MIETFFLCASSFTLGFFLMDTIWIYKFHKWIKEYNADGKKALLVDKEHLEKELAGAETPFDKLYKKLKDGDDV